MTLTLAQKQALKVAILANATAAPLYTDGNLTGLADFLNATFAPSFTVWKTSVSDDEIMQNGFEWARVDNLSIGKARIWEWMFGVTGFINPSKANVRAGIDQTWVGTQADLDVRASVYAHCKRDASWVEKLFATGTGTVAVPATLVVEGPVNTFDLIGL